MRRFFRFQIWIRTNNNLTAIPYSIANGDNTETNIEEPVKMLKIKSYYESVYSSPIRTLNVVQIMCINSRLIPKIVYRNHHCTLNRPVRYLFN